MKKKILLGILSALFILLILSLQTKFIANIDNSFYNFLITFRSDAMTSFMKIITNIASALFLILLTLVIVIFLKNNKTRIFLIINLILSTLINRIIKLIVHRSRPLVPHLVVEKSYSFPSGHTMSACCVYGFIIYLIIKSNLSRKLKILFSILLSILVILVGISRVYLGVHYLSDIIGAMLISGVVIISLTTLFNKFE